MALTGEPDDVAKTWKIKAKKEGEPEKLTPENCVFSGGGGKSRTRILVLGRLRVHSARASCKVCRGSRGDRGADSGSF